MEALGLGLFMVSAAGFAAILEHPASPVHRAVADPFLRRVLMGLAMGMTAIGLIYSPWGRRSGAHVNPAVTLTFFRLGKIAGRDAVGYIAGQFLGGILGILLLHAFIGRYLADPAVNYVATLPGPDGPGVAFIAEIAISFVLMLTVLWASNSRAARWTGFLAGALVSAYVVFESPLSGFSMNPARTFASAVPARLWTALWVYFTAPPIGMLLAAECYLRGGRARTVRCAKLYHDAASRCIFRCRYFEHSQPHAR